LDSFNERIEKLNNMIKESNYVVFYGGAGVSTESGIPDFRSKDGLYNQKDIKFDNYSAEYLLSHSCLYNNPKVFYEFYRQKLDCRGVNPNTAHYKLAELERKGKLKAIITQNIDGLHQKAGSSEVYEIHGTTKKNYCSKCKKEYPSDYIFTSTESIPKCECRGLIRPDVVLYEESLPKEAWEKSENAIQKADLLIIGGTSLTVYPAKNLISYYYGKNMVIINHDKTEFDQWADLVFHENIGDVFSKIEV
jgi:NAD-dependent deacetylase